MERIGRGVGVAALFNGRAKRVSAKTIRALERALPDALILVSEDLEQARRQAALIVEAKPYLLLSGGGDGAAVKLVNLWREESGGAPFPRIGVFKLGTGNAWARVSGAGDYWKQVEELPALARELPTTDFDLVEVEDTLCHFSGVGWDAKVLNDYLRNLDRRSSQLIGSRLASWFHRGVTGYLYATARLTVPEERKRYREHGPFRVTIDNLGETALCIDENGVAAPVGGEGGDARVRLYDGPISMGAFSTTPEWGFGFKAFPFARMQRGRMQLRLYDRKVLEAVRNSVRLWRNKMPRTPGLHDWLVSRVRLRFSHPMPFQIAGDGKGLRHELDMRVAQEVAPIVDWAAARILSRPAT